MSKPLVYVILGCKDSGQFQVVSDLIDFGADKEEVSVVLHSEGDETDALADFKVKTREATLQAYRWDDTALSLTIEGEPDLVFLVADGLADPADFMEAFHAWLPESGCELGRVMTVLHCEMAIAKHEAFAWFDCCIHFSDVILLNRRENVSNKEMKKYLDHYEEECFPCIFEYVKKGRVPNPMLLLETQPRRITRIFDEPEVFEGEDEEEEFEDDEDDIAGDITKDSYLKRVAGGRRAKVLPKIAEHL